MKNKWIFIGIITAVLLLAVIFFVFFLGGKEEQGEIVLTINNVGVTEEEYQIFYAATKSGIPEGKTRDDVTILFLTKYKIGQAWAKELGVPVTAEFHELKKEWKKENEGRENAQVAYGKGYSLAEYVSKTETETFYNLQQAYLEKSGAADPEQSEKVLKQFEEELQKRMNEAEIVKMGNGW